MNRRLSAWRASIAAGAAVGVFASAATLAGARGAFELKATERRSSAHARAT